MIENLYLVSCHNAQTIYHSQVSRAYLLHMLLRNMLSPDANYNTLLKQLKIDLEILNAIKNTHYLHGHPCVPKCENLSLAWEYAQSPTDHDHFINMLHVSPQVFETLLELIQDHEIFQNNSNSPQTPVQIQLAVTLYQMGQYRNGASLEDFRLIQLSRDNIYDKEIHTLSTLDLMQAPTLTELIW